MRSAQPWLLEPLNLQGDSTSSGQLVCLSHQMIQKWANLFGGPEGWSPFWVEAEMMPWPVKCGGKCRAHQVLRELCHLVIPKVQGGLMPSGSGQSAVAPQAA